MDDEGIIERFALPFQLTELEWPSIRRDGLLSTSALFDLSDVADPPSSQIEGQPRSRNSLHFAEFSAVKACFRKHESSNPLK
jgi:hypothetical protein